MTDQSPEKPQPNDLERELMQLAREVVDLRRRVRHLEKQVSALMGKRSVTEVSDVKK